MSGRIAALTTVAGLALGGYYYYVQPTAASVTKLEIEISGGFAYIPSQNEKTLYVAYLNSVEVKEDTDNDPKTAEEIVCSVPQVGTELMVVRGVVDDYQGPMPMPATRVFDLDKAQVRLPRLNNANTPTALRKSWKPLPVKASANAHWVDLQYLPRIADHTGLTNRKIKPNWRSDKNINGFIALKGGALTGTTPTNPIAEKAEFEFKVAGASQGYVSGTDKTVYKVDVPDDKVEIVFTGSAHGYKRLVLKPNSPGEAVRLRVRGLHATNVPPKDGEELKDFCVFHSLLEPPVTSKNYVRIFYKEPSSAAFAIAAAGDGMPSPGFFCDGNMF